MHKILLTIIAICVVVVGLVFWRSNAIPESGEAGFWESDAQTFLFIEQEVGGETIGSSSNITVRWEAPKKEYNHFLITIRDEEADFERRESREHDGFSLDLSALQPNTEYEIELKACLDPRCEAWYATDLVTGTTSAEYWQLTSDAWVILEDDVVREALYEDAGDFVVVDADGAPVEAEPVEVIERADEAYPMLIVKDERGIERLAELLNP